MFTSPIGGNTANSPSSTLRSARALAQAKGGLSGRLSSSLAMFAASGKASVRTLPEACAQAT